MINLESSLDLRKFDNSVMQGRLQEIFRGNIDLTKKLGELRQVTMHLLKPDRVGGNHYHKMKYEIIAHLTGNPIQVHLMNPQTKERFSTEVQRGYKFDLVPNIAHSLYCPEGKACLIEFTNLPFSEADLEKDLYRLNVFTLPQSQL